MRKIIFVSLLAGLSIVLTACGSAPTPAADTSASPVNITVETNPDSIMMDDATELVFNITDANGNPIEGATVDVSARHTDMSMSNMNGVAIEQGQGKYTINTAFNMSGTWKLTVYVRKDGLDYKEEIEIPVQ